MRQAIALLGIVFLTCFDASAEIRRFQSQDKTKSFFAELTGYDAKTKRVTVRMKSGRKSSFKIDLLSENDQKYVVANGKRLAVGNDIRLSLRKFQDKSIKKLAPRTVDRVYPSGYTISLSNRSKNTYTDLSVNYTLYYQVQGYLKPEREKKMSTGNLSCEKIVANQTVTLHTEKLDIVSGKLEPVIKYVSKTNAEGISYQEPVVAKPGGRRKDLLTGCKVEILVDGEVVKSETDGTISVIETK